MVFLRRSLIGVLLMALTLGALGWAGAAVYSAIVSTLSPDQKARPNRELVQAVNVIEFAAGTAQPVLETFGEIRSRRILDVRAAANGRLIEISPEFRNGGRVEAGDLLARIDPAEPEAALALAEADVQEADAEYREAVRGVGLAMDELEVAREQAALQQQALARQEDLRGRGVGSVAAVETAALSAASARQQVVSRRQGLAQAEARVDQALTRQARMQIALTEAQRLVDDTQIRAEFSGTLSDVSVVGGGLVSRNQQLGRLVDPNALEVSFRLSTAQYARLLDETGRLRRAPVRAVLKVAGVDLHADGVIERESAEVGTGLSGREIFARLQPSAALRPGDIVTVQITEVPLDNVAVLPALSMDPAGTVLVMGPDDRLQSQPVELLRRQGDLIMVRGDPALEGAEVITKRTPLLGVGLKVRALQTKPAEDAQLVSLTGETERMVEVSPDLRARLIAFVQADHALSEETRTRMLELLAGGQVPQALVERIEARMGG